MSLQPTSNVGSAVGDFAVVENTRNETLSAASAPKNYRSIPDIFEQEGAQKAGEVLQRVFTDLKDQRDALSLEKGRLTSQVAHLQGQISVMKNDRDKALKTAKVSQETGKLGVQTLKQHYQAKTHHLEQKLAQVQATLSFVEQELVQAKGVALQINADKQQIKADKQQINAAYKALLNSNEETIEASEQTLQQLKKVENHNKKMKHTLAESITQIEQMAVKLEVQGAQIAKYKVQDRKVEKFGNTLTTVHGYGMVGTGAALTVAGGGPFGVAMMIAGFGELMAVR